MAQSKSVDNTSAGLFSEFPVFTKLTLEDKPAYDRFISQFPPIDDISFASLMTWWDAGNIGTVATLNGNIIFQYWIPGDEHGSGIGLVGTSKLDETLCEIFDFQRSRGEKPCIVRVSEFVLPHIAYPELFTFESIAEYDEYVIDLQRLITTTGEIEHIEKKIRKVLSELGESNLEVRQLDLSTEHDRELILRSAYEWPTAQKISEVLLHEEASFEMSINHADQVGVKCIGLYIKDRPHAFLTYTLTQQNDVVIFGHFKLYDALPGMYDFAIFSFAQWLLGNGIKEVNISNDLGNENFRRLKLALGPSRHFRKYSIEPAPQPI